METINSFDYFHILLKGKDRKEKFSQFIERQLLVATDIIHGGHTCYNESF